MGTLHRNVPLNFFLYWRGSAHAFPRGEGGSPKARRMRNAGGNVRVRKVYQTY